MSGFTTDEKINMLLTNIDWHRRAIARAMKETDDPVKAAGLAVNLKMMAEHLAARTRERAGLPPTNEWRENYK